MAATISRLLTAAFVSATITTTAPAAFFTGDPAADGWTAAGNSQVLGGYIRGLADFDFDMYRTLYMVPESDALLSKTPWSVGDKIFGMGGVLATPTTLPLVNANLTKSVRVVSKYAAAAAPGFLADGAYSANPPTAAIGNGRGNFLAGDGGDGSVLISTAIGAITSVRAEKLQVPEFRFQYDTTMLNTNGKSLNDDVARFIYTGGLVGTEYLLKTWEVLLNVTLLPMPGPGPDYGVAWDQALQRGTKKFTDGLNAVPPMAPMSAARRAAVPSDFEGEGGPDAVATPLPPTLLALAAGATLLGLRRRHLRC